MHTPRQKLQVLLAISICCPLYLVAQNLVVNGGFDTDEGHWIANFAKAYQPVLGNPPGCVTLNDPSRRSVPTISQFVTGLTAGVSYAVTGDYKVAVDWGGGSPTNLSFGVALDGVFDFATPKPDPAWHSFGFTFIAASSDVNLSLSAQMNGTGVAYDIDNIVLQPVPSATASIVGAGFVLSWPTNAQGFGIQSSTNLVSGSWLDVTNQPVIAGSNYSITLTTTQESCYFRLKR